ncbi:MAG TPA: polyprenyl synthetase family protein [Anaerolineae bacterium]|nr:polyprenyl synthetase family protein [Anaerolineae bacterium]HOQ97630.1 polyprenyl synthetase family protein [Anaerolineae bacterium]HPL27828.1 polyprenyl synthetase family protein [Anaerolineae bacterium]
MKLPSVFARYRAEIDAELSLALADYDSPLYDMLRYHLGWVDAQGNRQPGPAGKALRPTLCLLAGEAVGADYRAVLPAAAAVELVHNFSLIHDDVQDDDRERRHRPTVWAVWGKPQAINAGTAMRVLAGLVLHRLSERGVPAERQLEAQRLLDESCLRLIEGQYLDISFEARLDVNVSEYLQMVELKTAVLIACSLELGALVGGAELPAVHAFGELGRNLGLAFQVRDDLLGIWGDEAKTGKPVGSDIRRRKKSLPIVYALERAEGAARAALAEIYRSGVDDRALATVLGILDASGARAQAERMATACCDRARTEMARLALPVEARRNLEEMAVFLANREF